MECVGKNKFDVVAELEKIIYAEGFIDISRSAAHARFLKIFQDTKGQIVPDDMLQHVYNETLSYFLATAETDEQYDNEKKAFDADVWPLLRERLRVNMSTVQFMLEYGVHSRYIATCLLDMDEHPAMLILMGHGIGHSVTGELEVIPKYDAAMRFMRDPSFSLFRYRDDKSREVALKAHKMLLLGGGAAVSLLMRGYPLGELNQEIVIYDTDATMKDRLEQIVGCPLEDVGIDYRISDFREAFSDPAQHDYYDYVEALGTAAYYSKNPEEFYGGIQSVLVKHGKTVFDNQVMSSPTLPFDVAIMGWNVKQGEQEMHTENSADDAIAVAKKNCEENGLDLLSYSVEEGVASPAGVVFLAVKP